MKGIYLAILASVLSVAGIAQKGNNQIGFGGEVNLPTSDFGEHFKTGFGIYTKAMYGVGKAGQVTFTSGYSSFKEIGEWADFNTTIRIVPLLIGYRHYFNSVFVEPQIGYGIYAAKVDVADEGTYTDSDGAFTCAAGVGYVFKNQLEVSARFQTGGKQGVNMGMFGARIGYNFSFGNKK